MIAVVTGGARGIGAAVVAKIRETGGTAIVVDQEKSADYMVDLYVPREIEDACRSIRNVYPKIDLLVNNAGISGNWVPIQSQTLDDWDRTIGVNLRSAYLMSKHLCSLLSGGSIVNISSTRALMSEPNTEAYSASKGGIVALTHSLAISLAEQKIRVNCISPGWIETGEYSQLSDEAHAQHPVRRVGQPVDVADAVMYLAAAEFASGTNLVLDGGMTRKMIYCE